MDCGWVGSNIPVIEPLAWERFDTTGSRYLVLRPYHLSGDALAANNPAFRSRDFTVLLRPDADGDLDVDRFCAAARTADIYSHAAVHLLMDNEPNLGSRPVDTGYVKALGNFVRDVKRRLGTGFTYVGTPLAVAQNDEAWNEALTPVYEQCHVIGVHCYGQASMDLIARQVALARTHGKRLVADEVGDSSPALGDRQRSAMVASYCRWLVDQGDVDALAIFIAGGTLDWRLYHLAPDTLGPVTGVFALGHAESPPPKEETMTATPTHIVWDAIPAVYASNPFIIAGTLGGVDGPGLATVFLRFPLDENGDAIWTDFPYMVPYSENGRLEQTVIAPPVPLDGPIPITFTTSAFEVVGDGRTVEAEMGITANVLQSVMYPASSAPAPTKPQPPVGQGGEVAPWLHEHYALAHQLELLGERITASGDTKNGGEVTRQGNELVRDNARRKDAYNQNPR